MGLEQQALHTGEVRRRVMANRARFLTLVAGILLPVMIMAYSSNPPLGITGAPGEGTCANCHQHGVLTTGSGFTLTVAGGLTYTPGGAPVGLTVALPTGSTGGFELSSGQ